MQNRPVSLRIQRALRAFFAAAGGAVDSRITSSGMIGTISGKLACPRMRCSRMRAATTPICSSG